MPVQDWSLPRGYGGIFVSLRSRVSAAPDTPEYQPCPVSGRDESDPAHGRGAEKARRAPHQWSTDFHVGRARGSLRPVVRPVRSTPIGAATS